MPALPGIIRRSLVAALVAATSSAASAGQQQDAPAGALTNPFGRKYPARIYRAARLQGPPPAIDGRFDDAAWREGEWSGDYTQQMPVEGAKPSQPTELQILYDDRHVYVAIRAYDDPALIHRYPGRRDDFNNYAVDVVGICFDSYNDKRTGFEFDLTAGGGKIDLVLGNGETEWDTNWDAVWDGKVGHDDRGWMAEFRIPLNQLRYGPQEEQIWGMHAWRWIARNGEEDQWQLIPRQNTGRMYQLGELHGIRGLPRSRHLELLPHVVGKAASGPSTGPATDGSGAVGLDAKLGLSTNFMLDATVNPDFGQVEADPSVVNLTAYETFYEEKRPFFLEARKIFDFQVDGSDQLFYSRRIGQVPSHAPDATAGETIRSPENTTIIGAAKVTGKTRGGLSVGVLQSVTQRETAVVRGPGLSRQVAVEPWGSYTVARVHKDWSKGNTSLGGMLTRTQRFIGDPSLAFMPAHATTGGMDFARYLDDRRWLVEATGLFSLVSGDRAAIRDLQMNAVHYYQRPDATHLGVDAGRTSLSGHGGSVRAGTSGQGRLRLSGTLHWYSPGLDLNDVGYLRQADTVASEVTVGWAEPRPMGMFRTYALEFSRQDQWDFGGLQTGTATAVEVSSTFRNRWESWAHLSFNQGVDTRALRGGPALRTQDYYELNLGISTDGARRTSASVEGGRAWSIDDGSASSELAAGVRVRPSNRVLLSGHLRRDTLRDDLQYVTAAGPADDRQYLLGRIEQNTWSFTLRANLTLTPDLTVQYYGSPFISTGGYSVFKRATTPLAGAHAQRFHPFAPGEISASRDGRTYEVSERGRTPFSFDNPDFTFRQFRSNLVLRWEYRPGSSVYLVWSQGRTTSEPYREGGLRRNWTGLWRASADDVVLVKASYWFSP